MEFEQFVIVLIYNPFRRNNILELGILLFTNIATASSVVVENR